MRFRVTTAAEAELDAIFAYWAERAGLETAGKLIDAIIDRFALLAEFPRAGKACPQIASSVRCFPASRYLIYYRRSRKAIEILHVFHAAREQPRSIDLEP
jgi:toxin ParE1/3/4